MSGWTTISVTLPDHLAVATLQAAEAAGQRTGPHAIRLQHFVILSERAFERLSNGLRDGSQQHCGGAATAPERGCDVPAPAVPGKTTSAV